MKAASAGVKPWHDHGIWWMPTGGEYDYFSTHVSDDMEREFRERMRRENAALKTARFLHENRWIGFGGEHSFERFLQKTEVDPRKYRYHDAPGKKSPLDFTVRVGDGFHIDVKTKWCSRYPPFSFRVDYNEDQLQENNRVDHIVFAQYVEKNRAMHLVGWCSKEEFIEVATLYRAGEMMIGQDGREYEVLYDMRIADIGEIRRMKTLWEKLTAQ